ncbi:MAG: hypothetical protein INF43_05685 [Alphaproteobacteria bacterium]|jgi:hypothetical protein|nr:hypothetical protein [Alphaproteobacteria bacterium]
MRVWLLLLLLVPAWGWTAARVGPLDGAKGPSLPAVAMPALAHEEELFNPWLAKELERRGMLAAATLEWTRLEREARGADRQQTLEALARLSYQQGQPALAAEFIIQLQDLNPTYQPGEGLLMAQLGAVQGASRTAVLQALQTRYPTSRESVTARWRAVWQEAAATGRVSQAWGLEMASLLEARLKFLRAEALTHYTLAVGLAVLPGAGHLVLQDWGRAVVLLVGWALFGLAFLSACRHRHYAYALVWAVPFVALWLNSPLSAAQSAELKAQHQRWQAMASWQDLRPAYSSVK